MCRVKRHVVRGGARAVIEGIVALLALVSLVVFGMPIGFAGIFVGGIGLLSMAGLKVGLLQLGILPYSLARNYNFLVVPLFLLMGHLAFEAGITRQIYRTGRSWLGHLPGGLGLATIFGGAGFAAACGASVASASVLTKVCLPELDANRYDRRLSLGCISSVGTFAMMIPPSSALVIFGVMTETSISRLLMAGILPGILTAMVYGIAVVIRVKLKPSIAPPLPAEPWSDRIRSSKDLLGTAALIFLVLGGIYSGIFTATEAAALGALGALILSVFARAPLLSMLPAALRSTAESTASVFTAVVGLLVFSVFLAYTGFPTLLVRLIVESQLSPHLVMTLIIILYIFMGMFFEPLGMMVLTLPVLFPVVVDLGFDPVWFGVITIKTAEIGMVTPPIGMNLYVMKATEPSLSLGDLFRGAGAFIPCDLVVLALLVAFPGIALLLPNSMFG